MTRVLSILVSVMTVAAFSPPVVAASIDASPSFRFESPFRLSNRAYLLSLKSTVARGEFNGRGFQVLVTRWSAPHHVSQGVADHYWKRMRGEAEEVSKVETDKGCKPLTDRLYRCSRTSGQNGRFVAEAVYWNDDADLVLLRITSSASMDHADAILSRFKGLQTPRTVSRPPGRHASKRSPASRSR